MNCNNNKTILLNRQYVQPMFFVCLHQSDQQEPTEIQ